MTIADRIKQRRADLQMRRDDLATAAGVTYVQIYRYENGDNQPTAEIIVALARALKVSTDWLLGYSQVLGIDSLTPLEQEILAVFRSKPEESQVTMIELMKVATKL